MNNCLHTIECYTSWNPASEHHHEEWQMTWCFCLLFICVFMFLATFYMYRHFRAIRRMYVKVHLNVWGWSYMKVYPDLPHPQVSLFLAFIILILQHTLIIALKSIHHNICCAGHWDISKYLPTTAPHFVDISPHLFPFYAATLCYVVSAVLYLNFLNSLFSFVCSRSFSSTHTCNHHKEH